MSPDDIEETSVGDEDQEHVDDSPYIVDIVDIVDDETEQTYRISPQTEAIAEIVPAETRESTPAWQRPGPRLVTSGEALAKAVLDERRSAL